MWRPLPPKDRAPTEERAHTSRRKTVLVMEKSQGSQTSLPQTMFSLLKLASWSYYSHCSVFLSPAHNIPSLSPSRNKRRKRKRFSLGNTLKNVTWNFNPSLRMPQTNKQNPYSNVFNFVLRPQDLKDEAPEQSSTSAPSLAPTGPRDRMEAAGGRLRRQQKRPRGNGVSSRVRKRSRVRHLASLPVPCASVPPRTPSLLTRLSDHPQSFS